MLRRCRVLRHLGPMPGATSNYSGISGARASASAVRDIVPGSTPIPPRPYAAKFDSAAAAFAPSHQFAADAVPRPDRDLSSAAPLSSFPPGWVGLTAELAAKARLGTGLHDDKDLPEAQRRPREKDRSDSVIVGAESTTTRKRSNTPDDSSEQLPAYTDADTQRFHGRHQPYQSVSPLSPVPRTLGATVNDDAANDTAQANSSVNHGSSLAVEAGEEFKAAVKTFELGDFGAAYTWFGRVMAFAQELEAQPVVDMFYTEITLTVPLTDAGRRVALFANMQETERAMRRNFSKGLGTGGEDVADELGVDEAVLEAARDRARHAFCWLLQEDKVKRDVFISEVFLQWYHRADYLVKRKGKQKKEYRANLTLEEILKSASQNRRRRVEKREERERLREEAQKMPLTPNIVAARKRAMQEMNSSKVGAKINQGLAVPKGTPTDAVLKKRARGIAIPVPTMRPTMDSAAGGSAGDIMDNTIADDEFSDADFKDQNEEGGVNATTHKSPLPQAPSASPMPASSTSAFAKQVRRHTVGSTPPVSTSSSSSSGKAPTAETFKKRRGYKGGIGSSESATSMVTEVLPREEREAMLKDYEYDDGMQDVKLGRGVLNRYSNRLR